MKLFDATLIQLLLAPSVLIPACGLLAMSTSARLSAIIARIRDLHRQRLSDYVLLDEDNERSRQVRTIRLEGLEVQAQCLIRRAGLTRASLLLEYTSIVALLLSSSSLGVAMIWEPAEYFAGAFFILGLTILLVAMLIAIFDVRQALRWVVYEHERLATLNVLEHNASQSVSGPLS